MLADIDHGAAKPGVQRDTKAAGWFTRFFVDPIKGLFGRLNLTKRGKELLENREYRFISPTFTLDENGCPNELHTASLTNVPAFAGHIDPVLNQEATEKPLNESITDMTKEELVDLIKETVKGMEQAEEKAEDKVETVEKEEVKEDCETVEETKEEPVENSCSEETKNEEPVEEVKVEEEPEEKKEEVIKIEALNSAPQGLADITKKSDWMYLHGKEFFDYLAKHPEIKG